MSGCYGDYVEWLSSSGFDTSYADNGINPFKDRRETDPEEEEGWGEDCDVETEEGLPVQYEDNGK
jgi:hypothetical protein